MACRPVSAVHLWVQVTFGVPRVNREAANWMVGAVQQAPHVEFFQHLEAPAKPIHYEGAFYEFLIHKWSAFQGMGSYFQVFDRFNHLVSQCWFVT